MCRNIILILTVLMIPLTLSAQLDTTRVYELDEVQFSPKRLRSEIVPYQRMDASVLTNLSCQTVADAVRYFSGVQLKDYGGVGGVKTLNIRSMGTNQMGVFYDGIQLGNAQNGQIDLGRFSLDNMESIDLYNGQRGSTLQSARDYGAAGTLYLTTKRPVFEDDKRWHIIGTMKCGSFGLANPSVTYEQKITDSVSFKASAEYTYANGKYKFRYRKVNADGSVAYDTTAIRENADINYVRTEAAFFGLVRNGEWKAQIYNYYSDRGLPGYIARNIFTHGQRQWDDNFFVQGSYRQRLDDRFSVLANVKYAYDYTRYLNPDTTLQYVDDSYRQQELYASAAASCRIFDWWNMSLATDFQWNYLDATIRDFAYPTRFTELAALSTTFRIPNFSLQASVLGTFVQESVVNGRSSANRNVFTPSVVASVRPWRSVLFDIRAFYKRIFRMPTFNDLYYTSIGNADLDPEFVNQYDFGLSYQYSDPYKVFSSFGIQVDAYYNYVENKIVAIPAANPFRWQMKNYGKVSIHGLDAAVDFGLRWARNWTLDMRLAYTYQIAADQSYDKESPYYGGQLPYIPWHSGTAVLNLAWKTLNLNYSFLYTGERYTSSANIVENYVQPWYTHDVAISYAFPIKSVNCKTSLEVNNLLNQQYEIVTGFPMPGTSFRIILKVDF